MRSLKCNRNALFSKNRLYELYDYTMKIGSLSVEDLCVEKCNIFKNLIVKICF